MSNIIKLANICIQHCQRPGSRRPQNWHYETVCIYMYMNLPAPEWTQPPLLAYKYIWVCSCGSL